MSLNDRGEWISRKCYLDKHDECFHEFDDGGGKPAFCDCDCHKKNQTWNLFADPRVVSDAILIELFNRKNLRGLVIPTGASAGRPELKNNLGLSIEGFEKIKSFLESK